MAICVERNSAGVIEEIHRRQAPDNGQFPAASPFQTGGGSVSTTTLSSTIHGFPFRICGSESLLYSLYQYHLVSIASRDACVKQSAKKHLLPVSCRCRCNCSTHSSPFQTGGGSVSTTTLSSTIRGFPFRICGSKNLLVKRL
jgi:hypothetical protein